MGYFRIKNIKFDKKNNKISADLADSNLYPIEYYHISDLSDCETFEEKYANFIYNVVSGNFHPQANNKYLKLVMNHLLENYYDDAHDIGNFATYEKYKDVVNGILTNNSNKCVLLESDRDINPERYYVLKPIKIKSKYEGDFYINAKYELFNYIEGKGLFICDTGEKNYGYPLCEVRDMMKFKKYNDFLNQYFISL